MNESILADSRTPRVVGAALDDPLRLSLFREMLRIRVVEEDLARRYSEQEMRCPVHFSIGQEAVAAGVCAALSPLDTVMSGHRSHAHYLAKGGDLKAMVAELYGKATGCARGKGGSMHLIDLKANFLGATSIVAETIPVAVGVAFAARLKGTGSVSVAFFGDGATEEGLFYESMNFAALHKLPVLFVCENNLYSVYSPLRVRQPASRRIYRVARALGAGSVRVDGNDVEAVYRAAAAALKGVRAGNGPYLIEAMTYRWLEHCGPNPDDHLGYRADGECDRWRRKDPVVNYGKKLAREGLTSGVESDSMRRAFADEIAEAVAYAKSCDYPDPGQLERDVYAR